MSASRILTAAVGLVLLAVPALAAQAEPIRRPTLGIVVDARSGPTDSIGARVESVTPGGPADRAGIRSGDIIVRFGGRSLLDPPALRGTAAGPQSAPALRLIMQSVRVAPHDTVPVQIRRGDKLRTVRVVPEPARATTFWRQPLPRGANQQERELREFEMLRGLEPSIATHIFQSPLAALQLAPLNEELGQYFGTSEGILVISVPRPSGLGLRGGDVILAVDGRKPSSPMHFLRILQSYDTRENITFDVLRNRRRETIQGRLATDR